ncbi:DUF4252 domain-containing protein [Aurantibacter aestuarii]|uniref:DUF4252 domain-containing protein n=1 Tax=Aurantibacter aestuarii TaxID=1266046 RepID=A0A2T1N5F8_9FLAO|nr:DUF4252 domain-containing protein [Aurantibacter aestuarii]PSG86497.1 DUF4252 domain-containing protein [Aurantibacter aestuarii]
MKTLNITFNQMKKSLTLLALALLITSTSMAQDIFSKYSDNGKVSYVSIKPKMFQLLAKMDINTDDPEAQQYLDMVNSITSFKTLATQDKVIALDLAKWVKGQSTKLEELMKVKDNGVQMTFYVKQGKDENHVSELIMFVDGLTDITKSANVNINGQNRSIDTVVISLTGDIDLNQISKLTSKMNLPGGSALENKSKK